MDDTVLLLIGIAGALWCATLPAYAVRRHNMETRDMARCLGGALRELLTTKAKWR